MEQGVIATVRPALNDTAPGIYVQGESWAFPTVQRVWDALSPLPLRIELDAAFPFGCGFGMSGASALATAHAIDALLELHSTQQHLGMIAHDAEVAAATGLGDVGGQFNGGIMIKTVKHQPLTVAQLPVTAETLHVRIHGPIHTADVIGSEAKLRLINAAGHTALSALTALGKNLTLGQLFDLSLTFAEDSGLLASPILQETIREIRAAGGHATMIMLGEAIVSDIPFPGSQPVKVTHRGGRVLL